MMWPFKTKEEKKPEIEIRLPEPNPEHVRIAYAADLLEQRKILNDYITNVSDDQEFAITVKDRSKIPPYTIQVVHLKPETFIDFLTGFREDIDAELTDLGVPLS